MIDGPPFTAFMIVVTKVNRIFAVMIRYGSGRTDSEWVLAWLVVLWLWFALETLPGLADFLID